MDGLMMSVAFADPLRRLSEAVEPRYGALILTLGLCGLRIGEAVALRVDDVNVLRRQLQVKRAASEVAGRLYVGKPKTATGRRNVPLPRVVADALAAHLTMFPPGADGLVFTAPEGAMIHRTT
jgi:integrase